MAAHTERHEKPGPAPPARPMTLIELIYHVTADPKRAFLLIAIVCCSVVSTWPMIIFACLVAIKLSPLKLIYATFASTFCSGFVITLIVIRVKKIRRSWKSRAANGGQLTTRNSRPQNPKPTPTPRKPRPKR